MTQASQAGQPPVLYSCRFGPDTITTQRWAGRLAVRLPRGRCFNDDYLDNHPFTQAVERLETDGGWQRECGGNSLMGDLASDWEPAHIFVGINLPILEAYAKGEGVMFLDPQMALWEVMQLPPYRPATAAAGLTLEAGR